MTQLTGIQKTAVTITTATAEHKRIQIINSSNKAKRLLTDYVVFEKTQCLRYIDLFNYVPETFNNVLYGLLANSLVAEACYAGCAIRQHIRRLHWEASLIDAHPTTAFAGIHNDVAHATLQSLCLTVGDTLAISTLAPLLANSAIRHGR